MVDSTGLQHAVINGSVLSLVLGVLVLGTLKYNARLFLQDYPKPIRDIVPPLSPTENRQRVVVSLAIIGVLIGGTLLSTLQLKSYGTLSFGTAYLCTFLVLAIFNIFDAVVLDLFILTLLKPRFVILPGSEGMEYLLNDYHKQFVDFLKGIAFCVVASLPLALLATL